MASKKNIIVFGEKGSGKTAIIEKFFGGKFDSNNIKGNDFFSYECYNTGEYCFIETYGLEQNCSDPINMQQLTETFSNFLNLLRKNAKTNFLVLVMRMGRVTELIENNYNLFNNIIFNNQLPVILIVTHCEKSLQMNQWWEENQNVFNSNYKMKFLLTFCVCADDGDGNGVDPDFAPLLRRKFEESINNFNQTLDIQSITCGFEPENFLEFKSSTMKKYLTFLRNSYEWDTHQNWSKVNRIFMKLVEEFNQIETKKEACSNQTSFEKYEKQVNPEHGENIEDIEFENSKNKTNKIQVGINVEKIPKQKIRKNKRDQGIERENPNSAVVKKKPRVMRTYFDFTFHIFNNIFQYFIAKVQRIWNYCFF